MTSDDCLLIQLAAFVDGEGTIGINRNLKSNNKYSYAQQLHVTNTDFRLMEWLVYNFGGTLPKPFNYGGNRKDAYNWYLSGYKSYKLIKKIRPYLILKQEQADDAIELYEKVSKFQYVTNRPMPEHKRELAARLHQRNKELNRKGKYENIEEVEVLVPVKVRKDVLDEWL